MLRPARPDDAEAVAEANNRCWQTAYRGVLPDEALDAIGPHDRVEAWRQWALDHPDRFVVAVDDDDRAVGYVTVDPAPVGEPDHVGEILSLYVHPDHWRSGVGRLLLDCGCRLLVDAGCTQGLLCTLADVAPTRAFYAAQGWLHDGSSYWYEFTDRPLAGAEQIRMRRALARKPELVANREHWNAQAHWYAETADRGWDRDAPTWGMFAIPDVRLGAMPDVTGKDVVELGCGTAYVGNYCVKGGARTVTGIDNSPGQLATAAAMAAARGVVLPLVHGDANQVPFRDQSFDVAINEYGAAIWCDPYEWIPEAARVLRDDGLLWFLGNSVIQMLSTADYEADKPDNRLRRPQRDMHRFTWPDDDGVEYHISHGDRIRLLRSAGFEILDLIEVYAEADSESRYHYADAQWASRWPIEEIWIARRLPR
ncbi:MAG: bifunctional GNAT family N-acetyltransferase/class I SAM-dependent methyltransferase [Acidimicrobiia bacterium]|nr:bifunctional GNAT family N-acetyltransferase/class I SAM-dependent methyltransferase [Acidimicrobiia bacterium]MDH5236003.1 bifunctional GNAT family N-acetyltransferase/class I SAM-dependent methyltransferase [Acidimicrobiia bacterium]